MHCFIDKTTDPYYNLAAEEYLLTGLDVPVFRLWRNSPAVIIGRYQNAAAEINREYASSHNIPVVRRMTGGGAVFHDLGNINFTFISPRVEGEDTAAMFRRFTAPIITALKNLGVDASLQGRNDLVIDGKKFSGNAICVHQDRVLQHGCLLFSASMTDLSEVLNSRPEKFIGKGVQSNRSRVTNVSEHLHEGNRMTVEDFISYVRDTVLKSDEYGDYVIRDYTDAEKAGIQDLYEKKYSTWEWNFGSSPAYAIQRYRRFACGFVEASLNVAGGKISSCKISGDYFFLRPTEEVEEALIGLPHEKEAIAARLGTMPITEYFGAVSPEELAEVFV